MKRNENGNEFISQCHMFKTYKLIPLITSTTNCIRPLLAMINYKFIRITIFKVTLYSASTKSLYHLFFKECLSLQYVISFNFFFNCIEKQMYCIISIFICIILFVLNRYNSLVFNNSYRLHCIILSPVYC